MSEKKEILSIDDKLDKIMEAIVFEQQLLLTCLKAMDSILVSKEAKSSKIIKPNGIG